MTNSPTALNKRGRKVHLDGYIFDSQKEADFYARFIKDCGFQFEVHKSFVLDQLEEIAPGIKAGQRKYTPDFVIYDEYGEMIHVYDVKNSFGAYGIDGRPKEKFSEFVHIYHIPVEAVVIRAHDFKVIAQGVTKQRKEKDPLIKRDVNYKWQDATGY